ASVIDWSPVADILAMRDADESLALWDPGAGPVVRLPGRVDQIEHVAWRPDGTALATDAGRPPAALAVVWNLRPGAVSAATAWIDKTDRQTDPRNRPRTYQLAWTPDGRHFAAWAPKNYYIRGLAGGTL